MSCSADEYGDYEWFIVLYTATATFKSPAMAVFWQTAWNIITTLPPSLKIMFSMKLPTRPWTHVNRLLTWWATVRTGGNGLEEANDYFFKTKTVQCSVMFGKMIGWYDEIIKHNYLCYVNIFVLGNDLVPELALSHYLIQLWCLKVWYNFITTHFE